MQAKYVCINCGYEIEITGFVPFTGKPTDLYYICKICSNNIFKYVEDTDATVLEDSYEEDLYFN